jgi:hypothetical protein
MDKIKNLVTDVLGLPSYFSKLVIARCANNPAATSITKLEFNKMWRELISETPHWRAFWLLSSEPSKKYLAKNDFLVLFK